MAVDEARSNRALARRYARAPRGQRAYGHGPRNHGPNLSGIGAVGLRGVVASFSVGGAGGTEAGNVLAPRGLSPALQPGEGVLLDTLNVPHASQIEAAVRHAHGSVRFLPPDFSGPLPD